MVDQPRAFVLLLILSAIPAFAQSFDCKLATTPREKTICTDTRLQALDAELAAAYKSLRAQLSPASAALVQSDQREWLRWIDLVCPAHGKGLADDQARCLQNEYFTRVHDLKIVTPFGSTLIFPRAHFLYKSGGPNEQNAAPNDPGFGYGSLRWPQIDKPNTAQTAFNAAVQTRAAQLAVGFDNNPGATFDTAVDPSGTIEGYFTIEAANDRIIDVTFTDGIYGWGAAHPNTGRTSFLWWLDQNRQLAASDIFNGDSGWQQQIVPLAITSLQSHTSIKDMLLKGAQLTNAVQSAVLEPANWTPTRNGLTITFPQYAVGPYVLGTPKANLSWADLKPYLATSFNPADMPPFTPPPPGGLKPSL